LGDKASGKSPHVAGKGWWEHAQPWSSLQEYPNNLGVATGYPLDGGVLLVVDVDGAEGWHTIEGLVSALGALPATYAVRTGRADGAGVHLYFRMDAPNIGAPDLGEAVDIRCRGGQVVGAGSLHYTGTTYQVLCDLPIATLPIAWEQHLRTLDQAATKPSAPPPGPAIELSREMVLQRVRELGAAHASFPLLWALGQGTPISRKGNAHKDIDLTLMTTLVGEFGPGVTDGAVLALVEPCHPSWSAKNGRRDSRYSHLYHWMWTGCRCARAAPRPPVPRFSRAPRPSGAAPP
jgi:hypothetical protein